MPWPLIIGAVMSLASGYLQKRQQDKQYGQMMDMIEQLSGKARKELSPQGWNPILQALFPGLVGGGGFGTNAGGQLAKQATDLLTNPGQISPIAYERGQEQANVMQNAMMQQFGQGAGGAGIDPSSGIQGANMLAGLLGIGQMRRENLRDFTQMSEQLRRSDIGLGQELLQYMYGTGLGVAGQRASTWTSQMGGMGDAMGAQLQAGNPFLGALGNVGGMFANYMGGGGGNAAAGAWAKGMAEQNLSGIQPMQPPSTAYKPVETNWSNLWKGR